MTVDETIYQTISDHLAGYHQRQVYFLTMVLSVVFYGFFYPFAYQAQRPADLPIVIVDEEQSPLTQAIIHTTSHTPNIHVLAVVSDFRQAQMLVQSAKADGILLLPDNLGQSIHHGQTGGVGCI